MRLRVTNSLAESPWSRSDLSLRLSVMVVYDPLIYPGQTGAVMAYQNARDSTGEDAPPT